MIKGAIKAGVKRVRVHGLADGRDVQDGSSKKYFTELRDFLAGLDIDAKIASGGGRMTVTMDRYEARAPRAPELPNSRLPCLRGDAMAVLRRVES